MAGEGRSFNLNQKRDSIIGKEFCRKLDHGCRAKTPPESTDGRLKAALRLILEVEKQIFEQGPSSPCSSNIAEKIRRK